METTFESLLYAVENGDNDFVAQAISNGANPNSRGEHNASLLHSASQCGCVEVVRTLLAGGADPNHIDDRGYSPMALAIGEQLQECDEVIQLLRDAGAQYGLTEAAANGDVSRVREILLADPKAVEVPAPMTLLWLLVCVGSRGGTVTERYEILELLCGYGFCAPPSEVKKLARGLNRKFQVLLRQLPIGRGE